MMKVKSLFCAFLICFSSLDTVYAGERRDLAPHIDGTWQMTHGNGVVERLGLSWSATSKQGRFTSQKTFKGRRIESFSGTWRVRTNSLLPPDSRTQLQLVWRDPVSGRKKGHRLAIRRITKREVTFASNLISSQTVIFGRVSA